MKRRFFVPQVIQTSAMDCGPAALKALFAGYGHYLSYGRLREVCHTDVDGTSLDTLEWVAAQLGMCMRQRLLPPDVLLLQSAYALPAVLVVQLPAGGAHLVVLWRAHGRWLQVMDPAVGRVWVRRDEFLRSLYLHEQRVDPADWNTWLESPEFAAMLCERLKHLRVAAPLWRDRAALDAALRFAETLRAAGRLQPGRDAGEFLRRCRQHREEIPRRFYTASSHAAHPGEWLMQGAVLMSVEGAAEVSGDLPPALKRVLDEPLPRPWQPAFEALRHCGATLPVLIGAALIAAAVGTAIEALVIRSLFDLARHLATTQQRLIIVGTTLILFVSLLLLDGWSSFGLMRMGRQIELRLRAQFARKVPRLNDAYFQSRLTSDMTFRAHWLQLARQLPDAVGHGLHLIASILMTAIAIAWVYPGAALWTVLAVLAACGVPWLFYSGLTERDLRCKEMSASLSSFYLDSLRGARAIQAHGAELMLRQAQGAQLRDWAVAGLKLQDLFLRANTLRAALAIACTVGLVYAQVGRGQTPAGLLLLIYWAMSIPSLGQDLADTLRALPGVRSTLLRFLELMGSPAPHAATTRTASCPVHGVAIDLQGIDVAVAGHTLLSDIRLNIRPGEHVAVVGASGAGKSSLLGCLLGWHAPTRGHIRIDGETLDEEIVSRLRAQTAWIDPQVHLFNRTLYQNIVYGNETFGSDRFAHAVETADLEPLLRRSVLGLQTAIGEGGCLLSGGEGQRVRAGRALLRPGVRLALLDEPVRGLARSQRRTLLASLRRHFASATLICVTHDVEDTADFDRVLVIEGGRLIEQGAPAELTLRDASPYRSLLATERTLHSNLWQHGSWRRLSLINGALHDSQEDA